MLTIYKYVLERINSLRIIRYLDTENIINTINMKQVGNKNFLELYAAKRKKLSHILNILFEYLIMI